MTSPTRPGVRTRTCQVPRAPCPTGYPEAGPSADRCPSYDRRTRSNARNGHGGSWSSVPRAYRARCPTGRPRGTSPAADRDYQWPETDRNVSKRLETSRERRPRRATTSTPSGSVTASGTAPLMTRNPAWAFRIDKRPKSTLHGKTSTWRSRVVVIIISIRIGILLVEHSRHAARRRHHVERHHVERFLLLRARARR